MDAATGTAGTPNYDYLLIVGPGRSGTELLYVNMSGHPRLRFPEAKEGGYYRRGASAMPPPAGDGGILADISNLAYNDAALGAGVSAMRRAGHRVLAAVILREHRDRALSMMRFRRSRGEFSAWFGDGRLQRSVVRDMLTAANLAEIYALEADVLALRFEHLVSDTKGALNAVADLCGIERFAEARGGLVNESLRPRFFPLSAAAKLAALGMRTVGLRRPLQRVKDARLPRKALFAPMTESEKRRFVLCDANARLLEASYGECLAVIEGRSERLADGVYFRRREGDGGG